MQRAHKPQLVQDLRQGGREAKPAAAKPRAGKTTETPAEGRRFFLWGHRSVLDAERHPPLNVRFIFEGEEESGGHAIYELLRADLAIIPGELEVRQANPEMSGPPFLEAHFGRGLLARRVEARLALGDLLEQHLGAPAAPGKHGNVVVAGTRDAEGAAPAEPAAGCQRRASQYIAQPLKREVRKLEDRLSGPRLVGPIRARAVKREQKAQKA